MRGVFCVLLIAFTSIFLSCSFFGPTQGGIDDNPNFIKGTVVDTSNIPVENAEVTIESVRLTRQGVEVLRQFVALTNAVGEYSFADIENGNYRLQTSFNGNSKSIGRLEISLDSTVLHPIVLSANVIVKGRVINSPLANVAVISQFQTTQTDENGFYTLPNMAPGKHDLMFFSDSLYNILTITILPTDDTVFMRDIALFEQTENNYLFFESSNTAAYFISHQEYEIGSEPLWYVGKNFDNVIYHQEVQENFYIFNNPLGMHYWHSRFSWVPSSVPSSTDTAVIINGLCVVNAPLENVTIFIEQNGRLLINDVVETGTGAIHLRGGELSFEYSEEIHFEFERDIYVEENSVISTLGIETKRIRPNQRLFGTGDITKLGFAELHLECDGSGFSGNWIIQEGKVRASLENSLGTGEVTVHPGSRLDNEAINGLAHLTRVSLLSGSGGNPGIIELDRPTTLRELVIDGEVMAPGLYYQTLNPIFFRGPDTLTVLE